MAKERRGVEAFSGCTRHELFCREAIAVFVDVCSEPVSQPTKSAGRDLLVELVLSGVGFDQLMRIVPARFEGVLRVRIAHQRKRHVVDLDVGAAERGKLADFGRPRRDRVAPEFLQIRIHRGIDRIAPAPEMQHGRRRNADFRRPVRLLLQKCERVGEDAFRAADLPGDADDVAGKFFDCGVVLKRQRGGDGLAAG